MPASAACGWPVSAEAADAVSPSGTYLPDGVADAGVDPTRDMYEDLNRAFRFFNTRLFGNTLRPSLITIRATGHTYGYFSAGRFVDTRTGERVNEIAFNPEAFAQNSVEDVLSTLAHEMVHQQQYELKTNSRRAYHNKDFENRMRAIGLVPSATGLPGGPSLGERMSHYVDVDGEFLKAANELVDASFRLRWSDRFVTRALTRVVFAKAQPSAPTRRRGTSSDETPPEGLALPPAALADPPTSEAVDEGGMPTPAAGALPPGVRISPAPVDLMGELQVPRPKPKAASSKTKQHCPGCYNAAWGKPSLHLVCGDCKLTFVLSD